MVDPGLRVGFALIAVQFVLWSPAQARPIQAGAMTGAEVGGEIGERPHSPGPRSLSAPPRTLTLQQLIYTGHCKEEGFQLVCRTLREFKGWKYSGPELEYQFATFGELPPGLFKCSDFSQTIRTYASLCSYDLADCIHVACHMIAQTGAPSSSTPVSGPGFLSSTTAAPNPSWRIEFPVKFEGPFVAVNGGPPPPPQPPAVPQAGDENEAGDEESGDDGASTTAASPPTSTTTASPSSSGASAATAASPSTSTMAASPSSSTAAAPLSSSSAGHPPPSETFIPNSSSEPGLESLKLDLMVTGSWFNSGEAVALYTLVPTAILIVVFIVWLKNSVNGLRLIIWTRAIWYWGRGCVRFYTLRAFIRTFKRGQIGSRASTVSRFWSILLDQQRQLVEREWQDVKYEDLMWLEILECKRRSVEKTAAEERAASVAACDTRQAGSFNCLSFRSEASTSGFLGETSGRLTRSLIEMPTTSAASSLTLDKSWLHDHLDLDDIPDNLLFSEDENAESDVDHANEGDSWVVMVLGVAEWFNPVAWILVLRRLIFDY